MMGYQCDNCREFTPLAPTQNMFGTQSLSMPAGWIIMTEQPRTTQFGSLLSALTETPSQPEPGQPPSFCSRACAADFFIAITLIENPAAT
jgi:hypothetical protein